MGEDELDAKSSTMPAVSFPFGSKTRMRGGGGGARRVWFKVGML